MLCMTTILREQRFSSCVCTKVTYLTRLMTLLQGNSIICSDIMLQVIIKPMKHALEISRNNFILLMCHPPGTFFALDNENGQ